MPAMPPAPFPRQDCYREALLSIVNRWLGFVLAPFGHLGLVEGRATYEIPMDGFVLEQRATLAYFPGGPSAFTESSAGVFDLSDAGRAPLRFWTGWRG